MPPEGNMPLDEIHGQASCLSPLADISFNRKGALTKRAVKSKKLSQPHTFLHKLALFGFELALFLRRLKA